VTHGKLERRDTLGRRNRRHEGGLRRGARTRRREGGDGGLRRRRQAARALRRADRGSDRDRSLLEGGIESGITHVELGSLGLEGRNGIAYEIGRYALRVCPGDEDTIVDRGKYLLVHERQRDGCWRWAVEMFNPGVPPEPSRPRVNGPSGDEIA
jgi:hypothetical protein